MENQNSKKRQRKFFRFRIIDILDHSDKIYLDIGAYSIKQAKFLAHKGIKTLDKRSWRINNYWKIQKPINSPEKSFIMKDGEVLSFK